MRRHRCPKTRSYRTFFRKPTIVRERHARYLLKTSILSRWTSREMHSERYTILPRQLRNEEGQKGGEFYAYVYRKVIASSSNPPTTADLDHACGQAAMCTSGALRRKPQKESQHKSRFTAKAGCGTIRLCKMNIPFTAFRRYSPKRTHTTRIVTKRGKSRLVMANSALQRGQRLI